MTFRPGDLLASINANEGMAKPSLYRVFIVPPLAMLTAAGGVGAALSIPIATDISLKAERVSLPGRQITTTPFTMYGTSAKMPYGVAYDDLSITFMCTNRMFERHFFDRWQSLITDPLNNYHNYYKNYVARIIIVKIPPGGDLGPDGLADLISSGNVPYSVLVEEAYPVTIQEQELSYDSDDYLRLTVQFAYRRWRSALDLIASGGSSGVPNSSFEFPTGSVPKAPSTDE